jgi:alpha-galactosidase
LSDDEKKAVAEQVKFYRRHRKLIQFGRFYRLLSPFAGNQTAWMIVSLDQKHALVWNIDVVNKANAPFETVRLVGLDPKRDYKVVGTKEVHGGDFLMSAGLPVPIQKHDFQSTLWELKAV